MNYLKIKYHILLILIAGLVGQNGFAQEKIVFNNEHDIDGDGKKDEISFDFSKSGHCCYTIYIKSSRTQKEYHYPFELDGNYSSGIDESNPSHFSIKDFDLDGKEEIFMEIATLNGRPHKVSKAWSDKYGVTSNYVLFDFENDTLKLVNEPWVISPEYYFSVKDKKQEEIQLFSYKQDSKYGFKDENGKIVLQPEWEQVGQFENNVAIVRHFQRTWLIDKRGVILKELNHKYVLNKFKSASGLYLLFDGIRSYYYMDNMGNIINPVPLPGAKAFIEGRGAIKDPESGLWGFVDSQLNWVILPEFKLVGEYKHGKVFVKKDGEAGYFVDYDGNKVSE